MEGEHGGTFTCSGAWWQGKVIVEEDWWLFELQWHY